MNNASVTAAGMFPGLFVRDFKFSESEFRFSIIIFASLLSSRLHLPSCVISPVLLYYSVGSGYSTGYYRYMVPFRSTCI